jgi:hypothetical protein
VHNFIGQGEKMNIKYIDFRRLNKYTKLYLKNVDLKDFMKIKIDFIIAVILDGAGINDYFEYEFYKKRRNERKKFVVRKKRKIIVRKFNNHKFEKYFSDKALFNECFQEFTKREWIDLDKATEEEFEKFVEKNTDFLIKPKAESCGIGIRVMQCKSDREIHKLYNYLKNRHVLIEEKLVQEGSIRELHPESLNTLRIVTVRVNEEVRVMNANLRVGIDHRIMDNFHQEGIAASIDISTGIVNSSGCDMHLNRHLTHPVTKEKIIGYSVPRWNEVITMVKKAAMKIPEISYVGWDVAVSCKKYGVVMIEGNPDPDTDVQQMCDQVGKWPDYETLVK